MPKDAPLFQPFSSDPRYWKLVELPKSQVLPVAPSLTAFARKPAIDTVAQVSGSLVNTRCRLCALATPAIDTNINNANEIRLINPAFDCLASRAIRPVPFVVLDPRETERRNPRTASIDLASPLEIVYLITAEDRRVPEVVATQRDQIARAIEIAESTFRRGGRVFYVGAGTSGRLGVLDASEIPPTFGAPSTLVQGIIAGGATRSG